MSSNFKYSLYCEFNAIVANGWGRVGLNLGR